MHFRVFLTELQPETFLLSLELLFLHYNWHYHKQRTLLINLFLERHDIYSVVFLEGHTFLLPSLPLLHKLRVYIDASAAMTLTNIVARGATHPTLPS